MSQLPLRLGPQHRPKRTPMRLRFVRDVRFPKFGMKAGESWECDEGWGTGQAYLEAIASGDDRFEFAGGHCLIQDVERVEP